MTEVKKYYENNYGGVHGESIFTPLGRCHFLDLVNPNTKYAPPKYGLTILFDKEDASAKEQLKAIQSMCREMFDQLAKTLWSKEKKKPEFEAFKARLLEDVRKQPIFRDGDEKAYEGFPGNFYIVAKNPKRITILDDVLPEAFEPGMIVRAQVQPYVDAGGFSYKITGLRLVKDDGVRFKSGPDGTSLLKGLDDAVVAVTVKKSTSEASVEASIDKSISSGAVESSLDVL